MQCAQKQYKEISSAERGMQSMSSNVSQSLASIQLVCCTNYSYLLVTCRHLMHMHGWAARPY